MSTEKALEKLFVSRVRIKILKYFFNHPDKPIHLRGAVREMGEEINAVRRELIRLDEVGLIFSETKGNRKYYHLNLNGPFIDELRGIIFKTYGLGGQIGKNIKKLGNISAIILLGNYISLDGSTDHPVDLIVIGDPNMELLNKIVQDIEEEEQKEINYTVLSDHDYVLRKRRKDTFISEILFAPKIMIYGTQETLLV